MLFESKCLIKIFFNMNRFKIMLALWIVLLGWCAFISVSPHMNAIAIGLAFVGSMVWFAHIEKKMNKNELRTFNRLRNVF